MSGPDTIIDRTFAGRRTIVPRPRLHDRLSDPSAPAPVLVLAPAGYGKTTLLTEWAGADGRPTAWVRPPTAGFDASTGAFVHAVASALDAVGVPGTDPAITARPGDDDPFDRLLTAVAGASGPFVLVVDDAHRLDDGFTARALDALAHAIPSGSQLVLSGRPRGPVPWHRLDERGDLVVLGGDDLALDGAEARALLAGHGLDAGDDAIAHLVDRTEGWPALLHLAARAVRGADDPTAAVLALRGTERSIAAYLDGEVLADLDVTTRHFLEDTSVVDLLTGPLCDAMLGTEHSASRLEGLVLAGWSFVEPLDHDRRAYRIHPLVAELLRDRLDQRDPADAIERCRRASRWCEARDLVDDAIALAARAGDAGRVGELALPVLLDRLVNRRAARLRAAVRTLGPAAVESTPALALVQCWMRMAAGDIVGAHQWLAITFAAVASAPERCSPYTLDAARCTRALAGAGGVDQVLRDAATVAPRGPGVSHWWILATTLRGHAHLMMGDRLDAATVLRDAEQFAGTNVVLHASALGNLALLSIVDGDWDGALALASQAEDELAHHRVEGYDVTVLVHAVSALALAHAGHTRDALPRIGRAVAMIDALGWAAPRHRIAGALLCGEALLLVGDPDRAAAMLARADELLLREPKALLLHDLRRSLCERLAPASGVPVASVGLTPAELRVLAHLPTHRSLREISEQLYVSPHTIKSQAISVYRKLGVRSRSEAVDVARELHLLPE